MRDLPKLISFKAVIFDLDGVIVDSEKAQFDTFNALLRHFGIRLARSYWKNECTGIGSPAIMGNVFKMNGISEDPRLWVKKRAAIYKKYVEKHGLPEIAGFHSFCNLLRKNKIKVAVASSGHKPHVAASLRAIGFPKIPYVGLEDVKKVKPAPDLFFLAAKRLGVKPGECLVFEDSLSGVEAASRARMPCVALATTVPSKALKGKAALIVKDFNSPALKRMALRLASGR
jgi:HAD superfamily hydrolase (TIGR01509 family)